MVTIEDVTEAINVSRAVVSRVLSSHPSIKMETRSHVMYWVKKLGHELNQVAQSPAGSRANIIGALFSDLSNPLHVSLMIVIVHETEIYSYSVILGDAQRDRAREANIINGFKRRKVDGIIVKPIRTPSRGLYNGVSIPLISLFKLADKKNITMSSEEGSMQVARHLRELGYRNMGYTGPLRSLTGNNKLEGSRDELEKNGLKIKAIVECSQYETAENQKAYEIIDQYFESHDLSKITAWSAYSDIAASDVTKALVEHGISVLKDVIARSYNNILLAKKMIPTLTSATSPIEEIIKNAVGLIIQGIEGDLEERVVNLSPRLVIRKPTSSLL